MSGVKVKALEWRRFGNNESAVAKCELGIYRAWARVGEGYYMRPYTRSHGILAGTSLDTAKAAAQADYESRIRSAIE